MSAWDTFRKIPPATVRLMARRRIVGTRKIAAMSDEEIAIAAGMSVDWVRATYHLRSWDGVPLGEIRKFCRACNFDIFDGVERNRCYTYARTATWAYLRRSPYWEDTFLPLIKRLKGDPT